MIFKLSVYTEGRIRPVVTIKCGDEYFEGFKKDLFDTEIPYLDCEELILKKNDIRKVKVKKISDN